MRKPAPLALASRCGLAASNSLPIEKGRTVANPALVSANIGFLSVTQEPSGFVGGYLVTNSWGRPLEFRLSSAVQPNKIQTILYGDTLQAYVCGEIIAKTLIEKNATP